MLTCAVVKVFVLTHVGWLFFESLPDLFVFLNKLPHMQRTYPLIIIITEQFINYLSKKFPTIEFEK